VAKITIEVPDNEDDIPAVIKSLNAQLAAVNAQRDAIIGAIRAAQKRCSHPNMRTGTDYGGGPDGHCPTCGYSY